MRERNLNLGTLELPGLLRALRSRNPQNIRNPLIFLRKMATYSYFGGSQGQLPS